MKKLLIVLMIFSVFILVSCSNKNYYDEMVELDPPIQVAISGENVWFTHELSLNDNEILYFAPRSVKIDGQVYLNKYSKYYIYTIKPTIFQFNQYRLASSDDLKEIFG
jgi:hypothetical protein